MIAPARGAKPFHHLITNLFTPDQLPGPFKRHRKRKKTIYFKKLQVQRYRFEIYFFWETVKILKFLISPDFRILSYVLSDVRLEWEYFWTVYSYILRWAISFTKIDKNGTKKVTFRKWNLFFISDLFCYKRSKVTVVPIGTIKYALFFHLKNQHRFWPKMVRYKEFWKYQYTTSENRDCE